LLLPPFYYKSPSEEGLYRFFSEVVEGVGDSRLNVYLYHFPAMSAVPIPLSLILNLRKAYGEAIRGVKDSSGDWSYTARLLTEIPGFAVFSGSEEFLLRNLQAGGPGCISASTNVTCRFAHGVYANWRSERAAALQEELLRFRCAIQKFPMQAAVKELLAVKTGNPDWRIVLPPNEQLSETQRAKLVREVGALI
jgi:4-hydroxy-tetrahydrodipicolinate synthase